MSVRALRLLVLVVSLGAAVAAPGQEGGSLLPPGSLSLFSGKLRVKGELKVNARHSSPEEARVASPSLPQPVFLRTVSTGTSIELSDASLTADADLTPDISGRVAVHFLDLYNRNPTSSDDRVFLREAWLRLGKKYESLVALPGTSVYLQLGKAPRFTKQLQRRFESYGLWGTAIGRFEEIGAEAGGSFGSIVYWRAQAVSGNPLFFRDPNALAGDNGTPERTSFTNPSPVFQSGFPILYDAKANDVSLKGKFQVGGGLGLRFTWREEKKDGLDVLGWVFRRTLAEKVAIRGSFYSGDLQLLKGFPGGPSLAIDGDEKLEYGVNVELRLGGLQLYGQLVHQEIAGLVRKGFEAELAYRIPLNGLFLWGETPVLNWLQPVARVSKIDNEFALPAGFVAPSMTWDWSKYDVGFRLGIVRGVDLTAEYARHEVILAARVAHPDEVLVTLRAGF